MPTLTINGSRTLDVPEYGTPIDIDQLQELVSRSGSHFFDRDTMRFFRSRVDYMVYPGADGWYFVTSEKHVSHTSYGTINEPRMYTVRRLSINAQPDLQLDEYEEFQHFKTLRGARACAERCTKSGTVKCPECKFRLVSALLIVPCAECVSRAFQQRS